MKHIVQFSGGKDSQATCIWVNNNISEKWEIVFSDTMWESKITYNFMLEFEAKISTNKNTLLSKKYNGFVDLATKKKRFPSTKARFCTQELKVIPMIDYILDEVQSDCKIYQGIRWDESRNRSTLQKKDCYFLNYHTPIITIDKKTGKQKKRYHTYRKKEVLRFLESFDATVVRPIISWTGTDAVKYILDNGYKYNPLYDLGFHRVGCFPCIMCNHGEIELLIKHFPERITEIESLENDLDSTFFPPDYIPNRYSSKVVEKTDNKTGERIEVKVPKIQDVVRYIKDRRMKQNVLFESTCKNVYVPCE